MSDTADGSTIGPPAVTNCRPSLKKASVTEFELVNTLKPSNFIMGELVGGYLSFIVENLPKDRTGCPGRWLFDQMMTHFGTNVTGIQGNWMGVASDNLTEMNRLTAAGVSYEDAAKQTWTGKRAADWLFTRVQVIRTIGSPGSFAQVTVLFTR